MLDVDVIEDPAAAIVALDPVRARLLAELAEPRSAAMLAERVGLTRQKVNYHLRALEAHGLVRVADERRWGGLTERLLQASAGAYVVSPDAVSAVAADSADGLSARRLVALAGRLIREVGRLTRTRGRVSTFSLDTEVQLRSAADRAAFAEALTRAVSAVVADHHHPDGVPHRVVVAAHPTPEDPA